MIAVPSFAPASRGEATGPRPVKDFFCELLGYGSPFQRLKPHSLKKSRAVSHSQAAVEQG